MCGRDAPMIEAVLFDLGDTLRHLHVPSPRALIRTAAVTFHQSLLNQGNHLPDFPAYYRHLRYHMICEFVRSRLVRRELRVVWMMQRAHRRLGISIASDEMVDLLTECLQVVRRFSRTEPDAIPSLTILRDSGYKLGLVSNTVFPAAGLDADLEDEGLLPFFPVRVYSSDVGYMKPDPRIFRIALKRVGVTPHRAMFVGDRLDKDVRGAGRLGMRTVLIVREGNKPRGRGRPDHVVRSLAEVPDILQLASHR
jgi:HAD superfamily hydrolase (TIGR01549 family)